jgi:hypothetical protein
MREGHTKLPSRTGISTGPMGQVQKELLSKLAKQRYDDGFVHPNTGKHHAESMRFKISASLKGRKVGSTTALKAVQTKRDRGFDFGSPARGHVLSLESRAIRGRAATHFFASTREQRRQPMLQRIQDAQLILLNEVDEPIFNLRCKICGYEFTRTAQCFQPAKFKVATCVQCHPPKPISDAENDLAAFIMTVTTSPVWRTDTTLIGPLELDIIMPDIKLAIEYCGLYWHSALAGRHKLYHPFKLKKCREIGFRLLTVFEDEWQKKREIVESMIRNACGAIPHKLNARQCEIREITTEESSEFLNTNHIQGRGRSSIKYGLFDHNDLVCVMTFSRGEVIHKSNGWEINRFATKLNHTVRGGASRLFKRFLDNHQPEKITSYADLRWGDGKVYGQLGFKWAGDTVPNYWYIKGLKRLHRFALRKTANDPPNQTEFVIRKAEGWNWIYDCGHAKWVWTRE